MGLYNCGGGGGIALDANGKIPMDKLPSTGLNLIEGEGINYPNQYYNQLKYINETYYMLFNNSNKLLYSKDAKLWSEANLPFVDDWLDIEYGNGVYVAIARDSTYTAYSTNGINWYKSSGQLPTYTDPWDSETKSIGPYRCAYGNGKFVLACSGHSSFGVNSLAYSTNGQTWNKITMPETGRFGRIYYIENKFVILTNDDYLYYSTNGTSNWTKKSIPITECYTLAHGNGMYVTCGSSAGFAYSEDGINWTKATIPSEYEKRYWTSMAFGNGMFVAVSLRQSHPNVLFAYSPDGINWTVQELDNAGWWEYVCFGDGKFVAVDEGNGIDDVANMLAYSTDGIEWTIDYVKQAGSTFKIVNNAGEDVTALLRSVLNSTSAASVMSAEQQATAINLAMIEQGQFATDLQLAMLEGEQNV